MIELSLKWLVNIISLFVVVYMAGGVSADSWQAVVIAALVLGLLNVFLRPIIILFTLPFNMLTLGLFTLIINGFIFYLTSKFVKGFNIISFWSAFWAAILFSFISFLLNILIRPKGITIRAPSGRKFNRSFDENIIDIEVSKREDKEEDKGE